MKFLEYDCAALHVLNRHSLYLSLDGAHVAEEWINVGPFLGQELVL